MTAVSQPSGTVTLVFSDIEGSTRLLEKLGTEAYREALAEHRRIVREAYARYSGYEVDYEGDAFFYAFSSASDAVSAVSEAMAGLKDGPIAIRVGLHTGRPALDPPKYVGLDVHFAARVMSSAHGGQVVLSQATASLLDLPLQDLGEHRLKDVEQAVSLYQLGEGSFPPLKSISNTNLPRPASSFLGRERELEQVLGRIEAGARLVTLTGPGGTGKTRLALEAAATLVPAYKAGVFWVGLASLRDPALVTETIAQTLGAKDGLAAHIGERELLLLLDNLEQVIECAPALAALLESCPNLTLLVTSRELLRITGEVEYAVPPLASEEAVSLFCARSGLEPSSEIAELCARLDSLPLAVELAAARTRALTVSQILERLSGRLDLLKGGRDADPRQQTLRATIEWSYDLLSPDEQELFASLSVFAGGCTLEAAEDVADADLDTLQSLVEKSLLRFTEGRYWMLETIREFAGERLSPHAADALARRHLSWFRDLAIESEPRFRGPEQGKWLRIVEGEIDNIRAALEAARGDASELQILTALGDFWDSRGYTREAQTRLLRALARHTSPTSDRAEALRVASELTLTLGDVSRSRSLAQDALSLARERGLDMLAARSLNNLGIAALFDDDLAAAAALFAQSAELRDSLGDVAGAARARGNLANALLVQGQLDAAERAFREMRDVFESLGDRWSVANAHCGLGDVAWARGEVSRSRDLYLDTLRVFSDVGTIEPIAEVIERLALIEADSGDPERAVCMLGAVEALRESTGAAGWELDRWRARRAGELAVSRLGPDVFARVLAQGRSMGVHDIVAFALEDGTPTLE